MHLEAILTLLNKDDVKRQRGGGAKRISLGQQLRLISSPPLSPVIDDRCSSRGGTSSAGATELEESSTVKEISEDTTIFQLSVVLSGDSSP